MFVAEEQRVFRLCIPGVSKNEQQRIGIEFLRQNGVVLTGHSILVLEKLQRWKMPDLQVVLDTYNKIKKVLGECVAPFLFIAERLCYNKADNYFWDTRKPTERIKVNSDALTNAYMRNESRNDAKVGSMDWGSHYGFIQGEKVDIWPDPGEEVEGNSILASFTVRSLGAKTIVMDHSSQHDGCENVKTGIEEWVIHQRTTLLAERKDAEAAPKKVSFGDTTIDPAAGQSPKKDDSDASKEPPQYPKGHKVFKNFKKVGWVEGKVIDYDPSSEWYKIVYPDTDQEDMTHEEVTTYSKAPCQKRTRVATAGACIEGVAKPVHTAKKEVSTLPQTSLSKMKKTDIHSEKPNKKRRKCSDMDEFRHEVQELSKTVAELTQMVGELSKTVEQVTTIPAVAEGLKQALPTSKG